MAILTEGQRYERNGLFATPETIDDLTDQLNSPEQWVAYGLTTNFLHNEFNKVLDNIQKELDKKYVFDSISDMIKHVKELEQGNDATR
tara:strand:- start:2223 stop:2486 length:264 start_codon:yes stop_codon:yes gene_type:complete